MCAKGEWPYSIVFSLLTKETRLSMQSVWFALALQIVHLYKWYPCCTFVQVVPLSRAIWFVPKQPVAWQRTAELIDSAVDCISPTKRETLLASKQIFLKQRAIRAKYEQMAQQSALAPYCHSQSLHWRQTLRLRSDGKDTKSPIQGKLMQSENIHWWKKDILFSTSLHWFHKKGT